MMIFLRNVALCGVKPSWSGEQRIAEFELHRSSVLRCEAPRQIKVPYGG
jgi:hypothetical protein